MFSTDALPFLLPDDPSAVSTPPGFEYGRSSLANSGRDEDEVDIDGWSDAAD